MKDDAVKQMIEKQTLEEKVKYLSAMTSCLSYGSEELGIPPIVMADGATGANGTHVILDFLCMMYLEMQGAKNEGESTEGDIVGFDVGSLMGEFSKLIAMKPEDAWEAAKSDPVKTAFMEFLQTRRNPAGAFISFPSGINIGACFNEERAEKIGKAIGKEMRANHVGMCLGPNVDIVRDPLGGRNYEMYGEDPVLVGRTAAAFVRGMQSTGIIACAKHFIANNQETNRQKKNTHVSERTLRELYARGFKAAVKEGGIKSVMTAYNAVNGVFSSYNKTIITDWLKGEWGFEGFVCSDWGAVTDHNDRAVAAGMDLILHGFLPENLHEITDAVQEGTLEESRIDDAIQRFLNVLFWHLETIGNQESDYRQEELLQCALETIIDGMVLLKNENTLPLAKETKITLYGSSAKEMTECGTGSTFVTTSLHSNIGEELEKLGITVSYEDMDAADTVIYAAAAQGGENADRVSMALDQEDESQIVDVLRMAKEKQKKTVVVLNIAAPIDMRSWIGYADAILCVFIPGCMGGKATAAVLSGEKAPGGRLPVTFPLKLSDSPASPFPVGEYDNVYYSEGIFNGYRWYDKKELPVLYPFGYGLTYTGFSYEVLSAPAGWDLEKEDNIEIRVRVKNEGSREGAAVIQAYLGAKCEKILMPEKEFMAYGKVYLEPGEAKELSLWIRKEDLTIYDPKQKEEIIPVGEYTLWIGENARSMFYEGTIQMEGRNPFVLGPDSTLAEILNDSHAAAVLQATVPSVLEYPEDTLKMLANEKIGVILERSLIGMIPNANELDAMLQKIFAQFAGEEN